MIDAATLLESVVARVRELEHRLQGRENLQLARGALAGLDAGDDASLLVREQVRNAERQIDDASRELFEIQAAFASAHNSVLGSSGTSALQWKSGALNSLPKAAFVEDLSPYAHMGRLRKVLADLMPARGADVPASIPAEPVVFGSVRDGVVRLGPGELQTLHYLLVRAPRLMPGDVAWEIVERLGKQIGRGRGDGYARAADILSAVVPSREDVAREKRKLVLVRKPAVVEKVSMPVGEIGEAAGAVVEFVRRLRKLSKGQIGFGVLPLRFEPAARFYPAILEMVEAVRVSDFPVLPGRQPKPKPLPLETHGRTKHQTERRINHASWQYGPAKELLKLVEKHVLETPPAKEKQKRAARTPAAAPPARRRRLDPRPQPSQLSKPSQPSKPSNPQPSQEDDEDEDDGYYHGRSEEECGYDSEEDGDDSEESEDDDGDE